MINVDHPRSDISMPGISLLKAFHYSLLHPKFNNTQWSSHSNDDDKKNRVLLENTRYTRSTTKRANTLYKIRNQFDLEWKEILVTSCFNGASSFGSASGSFFGGGSSLLTGAAPPSAGCCGGASSLRQLEQTPIMNAKCRCGSLGSVGLQRRKMKSWNRNRNRNRTESESAKWIIGFSG